MALTQVTSIGLKDGEIVNADLHSAASVALSKLASTGALGSAVTATTQSASDDSTKLATTAFVQAAVTSLIDGAPGSLNTLNELAAAINDDSSYATTLTTALATKLPLAGGTLTGTLTIGNGSITTGSNFSLNGNALTVTGTSGTVIEGKRAGSATIQATNTTNSTDLQLRADATGGLVRTASNKPLLFGTNQTERLHIGSTGNVKIGSGTPGAKFHVEDANTTAYNTAATTSAASIYLVNTGTNGPLGIILQNASTDGSNTCQATIHSVAEGTNKDTALTLGTRQNSDATIRERLRITSGGNVGIGNINPGELLSLRHATSNTVLDFECLAANDGTTGNIIKFRGKGANGVSYHASQIKGITENAANNAGFLSFWTNSAGTVSEKLRITSEGRVGIGVTSPPQALSVFGNIYQRQGDVITWNNGDCQIGGVSGYHFVISTYTGSSMTEKLRVTSGGNVGIGTASPTVGYGGDKGLHIHSTLTSGTRGSTIHLTSGTTGTAAGDGSKIHQSDNDLAITNYENARLDLGTNGSHRLTIKGDGNVGIGTDSPATRLEVKDNENNNLATSIRLSQGYNSAFSEIASNFGGSMTLNAGQGGGTPVMHFQVNDSEKMRLTNNGRLGINNSNPQDRIHLQSGWLRIHAAEQTSSDYSASYGVRWTQETDVEVAKIYVTRPAWGGAPSQMHFQCRDEENNLYGAMKISGWSGGRTGASGSAKIMKHGVAFGNAGCAIDKGWYDQCGIHIFHTNSFGNTTKGQFRIHGWNTSYASYPEANGSDFSANLIADGGVTTSDRRRKTDIVNITDALDSVCKLQGTKFVFVNRDLDKQTHMSMANGVKLGFIAQDVIDTGLTEVVHDAGASAIVEDNGYCDRYGIDYGSLVPLLVEAIKELKAANDSLQSRISVLEAS